MKISLLQFSDALINNNPLYRPFSDFTLFLSSISYTEAVEILKQASQNFTFTPEVGYIYMKISFSYLSDFIKNPLK